MANQRKPLGPIGFYLVLGLVVLIFFLFPATLRLFEGAARQLRYVWWLILLLGAVLWLWYRLRRRR